MPEVSWGEVLEYSDVREVRPPRRRARVATVLRPARLEAMFWLLFSAGGMVAAFLFPIHIALLGIAHAFGWLPDDALSYDRVIGYVRHPVTRLYLWGLVSLPLFHWAHRFRYVVHHQFGIHGARALVAVACYGTAAAGTVLSGIVIWTI